MKEQTRPLDLSQYTDYIREGAVFIITEGEYEDYKVFGIYQALQDLTPLVFRMGHNAIAATQQNIIAWLIEHEWIRLVSQTELYLGQYVVVAEPWETDYPLRPEICSLKREEL